MASQSYATRVTNRIGPTLAAHPDWSRSDAIRYLRGHGAPGGGITPEHGGKGRGLPTGAAGHRVGRVAPTYRDSRAVAEINRIADEPSGRVQINVHTRGGGTEVIGGKYSGYDAKFVAQLIADHNGDVRAAMAELIADHESDFDLDGYDDASAYVAAIDSWQVVDSTR